MAPTAADLITRLRIVLEAESVEDLARKIHVPLRTVQRWSTMTSGGPSYDMAVSLLEQAGWLRDQPDQALVSQIVTQLEQGEDPQEADLRELSDQLAELSSRLRRAADGRDERSHPE